MKKETTVFVRVPIMAFGILLLIRLAANLRRICATGITWTFA